MDPLQHKHSNLIEHVRKMIYQLEDVSEHDTDLAERLEELERYYKIIIDRELRMVEMRKSITKLEQELQLEKNIDSP